MRVSNVGLRAERDPPRGARVPGLLALRARRHRLHARPRRRAARLGARLPRRHYAPNLAVLSIAGDFEPDEAMQLVHRYFDTAKKQDEGRPLRASASSRRRGAPHSAVARGRARQDARLLLRLGHPAGARGRPLRARARQRHPRRRRELAPPSEARSRPGARAGSVRIGPRTTAGPISSGLAGEARRGSRLADTEKAVDAQIDALAKNGPTDAEMTKAQQPHGGLVPLRPAIEPAARHQARPVRALLGRRAALSAEPPKYFAVTKDDVKRVTAQYLAPARRRSWRCGPPAWPKSPPPPPRVKAAAVPAPPKGAKAPPRPDKKHTSCSARNAKGACTSPSARRRRHEARSPFFRSSRRSWRRLATQRTGQHPMAVQIPVPQGGSGEAMTAGARGAPDFGPRARDALSQDRASSTLDNGLEIDVVQAHALPLVQLRVRREERRRHRRRSHRASPTSPRTCSRTAARDATRAAIWSPRSRAWVPISASR